MSDKHITDEEPDEERIVSARNPELARRMDELRQRAEQADALAKQAIELINEKDNEIAQLKAENTELRERIEALENDTAIIAHVNEARAMDVDDRAIACIQTLVNDAGTNGKASMTISEGWSTLGREFDRTRMYDVFKRAESLVGNDNVCWYQKEPRSANKVSRLVLDRTGGELPEKVGEKRLRGGSR